MLDKKATVKEALLFSYVVASADMRYIEESEREIRLRIDPNLGPIVRGEFSGCGPGCYADLSQIFLEYAMSCEGCKDHQMTEEAITGFGDRLGSVLGARLRKSEDESPPIDRLSGAFTCVLNSMNVPFKEEQGEGSLHYILEHCPLCESGSKTGLGREMVVARTGFAAFSESLVRSLAPDWVVLTPTASEPVDTLLEITLART